MHASEFIHLRVHTAYSLLEGAIQVKALAKLCAGEGFPAVAVTDSNNLFGALEASEALAGAGVQPIVGCQLAVFYAGAARMGDAPPPPAPIVLLAQNEDGYNNLMKLSSIGYLQSEGETGVRMGQLREWSSGLICLSGGADGPAGRLIRAGKAAEAQAHLSELQAIFGDRFYVELQRHGSGAFPRTEAEEACEPVFVDWAYAHDAPLVATNDVYFAKREDHSAHDALICIAESRYVSETDRRKLTPEHYFKPAAEMAQVFNDLPEAVENTVEIAKRCGFRVRKRDPILPRFAENEVEELRRQAREGLDARLTVIDPVAPRETYAERLEFELSVIEKMGFPGYFLIVADFIKWAKGQGIPVGPGRGSGAGSLVAYALTITDLDPLRYSLLFERFLNPERVSMPDFDIDFCENRREEVIRYVQRRYGAEQVAQIITFGTLQAKAALRDVGRVLQMPYGQVDRLCKMLPMDGVKPVPIKQSVEQEPRLREEAEKDPTVARMLSIGAALEGLLRNASKHAAGVVIGDRPLDQLTPLYRDPRSDMPATQFNMKWVEAAGLVKFDFLGLKTLTVLQGALDFIKARGEIVDIDRIPLDDKKTYDLYCRGDTVAVFQVESSGMREALRGLKPDCIEDIIALVALYRPGPMDNIPRYCAIKEGLEPPDYLHPSLEPILKETHGIIVYQEQVMQIAQVLAGYSLGQADLLRRAMGKKIKEAMDEQREIFVRGAVERGVSKGKANEIFDLLAKFANYGFNKSHAAAYALVSYQTGYLKANYPVEFMAAVMNLDLHLTDKLADYKQELDRMKIPLRPVCVNRSSARFAVEDGAVVYALGALKNVGVEAMAAIERERRENGAFKDIFDFMRRIDPKQINKRALENLIRAGAMDALDRNRRRLFESVDALMAYAQSVANERGSGQDSLFGGEPGAQTPRLADTVDWLPTERLTEEQGAIGFYLSGHPLDDYGPALQRKGVFSLAALTRLCGSRPRSASIAGVVLARQERKSQKGNRFAFVKLSDPTGAYEATVFSEALTRHRDDLEPGKSVVLAVEASAEGEQLKLRVQGVQAIDAALADAAETGVRVFVEGEAGVEVVRKQLAPAAVGPVKARGAGPVRLVLAAAREAAEVELRLPGFYAVSPQLRGALRASPGVRGVEDL